MNQGNGKKIGIFVGIAVVCFVLVYAGIALTQNRGKTSTEVRTEDARRSLDKMLKNVYIEEIEARKASVSLASSSLAEELPDISKYPLAVEGNGPINIEITTSTEKGGTGNDGWLNAVAKEFNESNTQVGGQQVSVSIRSMASGLAVDYIISGKYRPDAFTPSNELWGEMIRSEGIEIEKVAERLVGNVAGILLSKENTQVLKEAYGDVDMTSITTATAENALAMGYTNPLASSTGLNFLLSTLYAYDPSNPLSEAAVAGFNAFQLNVPFVAYTTLQMREAAGTGSLEGMILEYQTYVNEPELASYEFTPFGIRHDNPLYSIGELSVDQQEGLEMFLDFCKGESSQQLANECGFNGLDDYKCDQPTTDGKVLKAAQKLWKENKDGGRPITAVFIADISGSMDGEPLNQLKSSLINSAQYINEDNYVGLISYNNDVYMNLPIAKFDLNQWSYFQGAVEDLEAGGGTSTYDAICVGLDMLVQAKEQNPNTKQMLFLLSDGEQNVGHSLDQIRGVVAAYGIPIYTIGYNANISALQMLSDINEAASIQAESDDVIYKLKSLFNAQM